MTSHTAHMMGIVVTLQISTLRGLGRRNLFETASMLTRFLPSNKSVELLVKKIKYGIVSKLIIKVIGNRTIGR